MNRKGFIGDVMTIIIIMLIVSIVVVTTYVFITEFNDTMQTIPAGNTESRYISSTITNQYPGAMDGALAFVFIGLPLVAATFAVFLDTRSILLWILVGSAFIFILIGAAFSNIWDVFVNADSLFSTAVTGFPITNFILENYAIYTLASIFMITGGFFLKRRTGL